jgi:hypothetical protein
MASIDTAVVEPSPIVSQPLSTPDIDLADESDISEDLSFNKLSTIFKFQWRKPEYAEKTNLTFVYCVQLGMVRSDCSF